jgi:hypothetical protein
VPGPEIVDAELVEDDQIESTRLTSLEQIFGGGFGWKHATPESVLATTIVDDAVPLSGTVEGAGDAHDVAAAPAPVAAAVVVLPRSNDAEDGTRRVRSAGPCPARCTSGYVLNGSTVAYCRYCHAEAATPVGVAA